MDCVQRALDDAQLTPSAIDKVVLVGGSTRTPLVSAAAGGAAGPAGRIRRSTRTCAWRWGRRCRRRSSPAPTSGRCWWTSRRTRWASSAWTSRWASRSSSASRRSSTATRRCRPRAASCSTPTATARREVEIDVYQGESDDVRRNHRVGKFMIQGLAPVPAGNPIVVQLDLNLDGMLKVSARERATGLQKQVVIENALAQFEARGARRGPRAARPAVGATRREDVRGRREARTEGERGRRRTKCRRWRRGRARASARRCRRGPCWRRRSGCWSACRRRTGRRWSG